MASAPFSTAKFERTRLQCSSGRTSTATISHGHAAPRTAAAALSLLKQAPLTLRFSGPSNESTPPRSSGHGSRAAGASRRSARSASVSARRHRHGAGGGYMHSGSLPSLPCSSTTTRSRSSVPSVPAPSFSATHSRVAVCSESPSLRADSRAHFNAHERPTSEHTDPAGCAKMQISGNRNRWYFQRGDRVARTVPARIRPAQSVATLEIVRRPRRWLFSDRDGQMHRHKPTPAPALRVLVTTPKTRNGSPAVCPCFAFFAHTGAFYRFFLQARAGRSMTLFRLFLLRPFRTRVLEYYRLAVYVHQGVAYTVLK